MERLTPVSILMFVTRLLGVSAALWPTPTRAHGADANQIQFIVHEQVAELTATPPTEFSALHFADDDRDGLLSRPEMDAHRPEIREALVASVGLFDEHGRAAVLERADVSLPQAGATPGAIGREFVRLTLRLNFEAPPRAVRVDCGFVGQHPVSLIATRADSAVRPGVLALVGATETGLHQSGQTQLTVLRSPGAQRVPDPAQVAAGRPFNPQAATARGLGSGLRGARPSALCHQVFG